MSRLELYVPVRTYSPNGGHGHWTVTAARRKHQRTELAWYWRYAAAGVSQLFEQAAAGIVVTLVRCANRELDDDNLAASMKAIRDQVADELGLSSDRDPRVVWRYAQERAPLGTYGVRIVVEPRTRTEGVQP